MAKNMTGHKAAGGLHSKNVVRPGIREGAKASGINPHHPGQPGIMMGSHSTEHGGRLPSGKIVEKMQTVAPTAASVPLGNTLVTNVGGGGPGKGRTVYATGTQMTHGPVAAGAERPLPSLEGRNVVLERGRR
jgi:hypothetical protein